MDYTSTHNRFRSVPLIQRGDYASLGGMTAAGQPDAGYASSARQAAPMRELPERDAEDSPRRTDRGRRQPSDRDGRRSAARTRTRTETDDRRSRSRSRRSSESDFGHSRLPAGESASAYVGSSGVVGVTRRSDRTQRPTSRFSLVGEETSSDAWQDPWQEFYPSRDERTEPRETHRLRSSRQEGGPRVSRVPREALFTEEDYAAGIPGAARRREAVVAGLQVIPNSLSSLADAFALHLRGVTLMAVTAMVAFMLFAPVRNLYLARRQLDTLQATYDVLVEENDSIRGELEALQTREGIENEARERGYVEPGETKVVVEGLPDHEEFSAAEEALSDVEVPDNRPWYIRLFDQFFGYDPEA